MLAFDIYIPLLYQVEALFAKTKYIADVILFEFVLKFHPVQNLNQYTAQTACVAVPKVFVSIQLPCSIVHFTQILANALVPVSRFKRVTAFVCVFQAVILAPIPLAA